MTPYSELPPEAFWRSAVAQRNPLEISGLWTPKTAFPAGVRIATAGSCFAQNIGAALRRHGLGWINAEPAPRAMSPELRKRFGYELFSFRTGNIYTARQLRQWLTWASGKEQAPDQTWRRGDRFFDPFRPGLEPDGFETAEDVKAARETTLKAIADAVSSADVFVFTLGLTECWRERETGLEYPSCPGVIAGEWSDEQYVFHNQSFAEIQATMADCFALLQTLRPGLRILLTVSPVPLTATATGGHVLVSTTHSKSVLRAVAGELAAGEALYDYFPSYEIITAPAFRGYFFAPNMREVSPRGVDVVMSHFLPHLMTEADRPQDAGAPPRTTEAPPTSDADPVCDEMVLDRYAVR